jgi:hypothetical protein
MARVIFTITTQAATVILDNRPKVVPSTSPNYAPLTEELRKGSHDVARIRTLADVYAFVAVASHGEVQVSRGEVRWRGEKVKNVVADRILDLLQSGHDLTSLANFLGRVMQNPLASARDELFLWLEAGRQPITPEGMILAYKIVRADYKDIYTGRFDNSVGQTVTMPREHVDQNRRHTCSVGLHFAAYAYLSHYSTASDAHIMILLVDPADVVAVPSDYSNQKGRTWKYVVIGEVERERAETFFDRSPLVEVHPVVATKVGYEDGEGIDEEDDDDEIVEGLDEDTENEIVSSLDEGDDDDDHRVDTTLLVGPDLSEVEEPVAPPAPTPADKLFTHKAPSGTSKSYLGSELLALVARNGQRGTAKLTGIARTTIQEWLKAISRPAGDVSPAE